MDTVALLVIAGGLCLLAAGAVGLLAGAIVVLASNSVLGHGVRVSPDTRNMANMADPGHMDPITGHLFREDEL